MFQPAYPRQTGAGLLAIPERLAAPRAYTGRGVTIAVIDSGFYPHPDFSRRVLVHVDAAFPTLVESRRYAAVRGPSWHGTMTAALAAGSGRQSGGRYAGLAPEARLALVAVTNPRGQVREADILRGLRWVRDHGLRFGIRVVSLSVGGDTPCADPNHPIHSLIRDLDAHGVIVVAAAGNAGHARLVPPASAPEAITVGGLDDHNSADSGKWTLYHHNWGRASNGAVKPDLLAPAAWVASPLLPGTPQARAAARLAGLLTVAEGDEVHALRLIRQQRRILGLSAAGARALTPDVFAAVEAHLAKYKVVDAHYQVVDGTSVAAAIVTGAVAQLLQANPALTPRAVRDILRATARPLPGIPAERQGAGVIQVAQALAEARRRAGRNAS